MLTSHNAFFAIFCHVTWLYLKEVFCKTKKVYTLVCIGKLRSTRGEFSSKNELFGVHTTHDTKKRPWGLSLTAFKFKIRWFQAMMVAVSTHEFRVHTWNAISKANYMILRYFFIWWNYMHCNAFFIYTEKLTIIQDQWRHICHI